MIEYAEITTLEDQQMRVLFVRVVSPRYCDHRSGGLEKRIDGAECVHCGVRLSEDHLERLLAQEV